jgi:hypothetical protein
LYGERVPYVVVNPTDSSRLIDMVVNPLLLANSDVRTFIFSSQIASHLYCNRSYL